MEAPVLTEATNVVQSSNVGKAMWSHALISGAEDFIGERIKDVFNELDDTPLCSLNPADVQQKVDDLLACIDELGVAQWLLRPRTVQCTYMGMQFGMEVTSGPHQIELFKALYLKNRCLGLG